jgi:chromosomal replication initiator protein
MQENIFWDSCLLSFEKSLSPQQFSAWIRPLRLIKEGDSLILTAPTSFTLNLVRERFFS